MDFKREADFYAEAYLGEKAQVEQADDGSLYIEGLAASLGVDDQDEMFEPGAFDEGITDFLTRNPLLAYHHDGSKALGQVLSLEKVDEGLWMKARIDPPVDAKSWEAGVVDKIKRGTIRGLSVRGKFLRRMGADGIPRIWKAGLREISVTPLPVHPKTLFALAQKAFEEEVDEETLGVISRALDGVESALAQAEGKAQTQPCGCGEEEEGQKAAPTAEQRRKYGMSDGSFPIWHCGSGPGSVKSAKALVGKGNQPRDKVVAHIKRRAAALGCSDQVKDLK